MTFVSYFLGFTVVRWIERLLSLYFSSPEEPPRAFLSVKSKGGPWYWTLRAGCWRLGEEEEEKKWLPGILCVCDLAKNNRVPDSTAPSFHIPFLLPVDDNHCGDGGSPRQITMMREMMTTMDALCGRQSSPAM